ncbi:MAG TPA: [Fe-Fe] hydrogenase large subunit C-terminal domain-containing protein [Ignavibacteriaceae bacterium]|nr:[Fe-Fe] hydrogenase large subunit C-terminal domain-containing protein [Ignavibacteriaceae bacterium]
MNVGIVSTISDKCKRCYSCIRECPAKAIKVINGQAAVIPERCIACGHCVKVCSQHGKLIMSDIDKVVNEILPNYQSFAIVAPSFAASFPDNYNKVPAALKALGFNSVVETAFGADLISNNYLEEFNSEDKNTVISSACPAVVSYIEKYFKELVPNLAKVVSPMIALGRYLRATVSNDIKVVFIGPCIAKKKEALENDEIDAVLTFSEIKKLFKLNNIDLSDLGEVDFDPPHAYMGKSYPLAGGLLKTADISDDILEKEIIVVEGKRKVIEIIDELSDNKINAKFLDILFCEGCISGPAIDSSLNYYSRREKVIKYIEQNLHSIDKHIWKSDLYNSRNLDLTRSFEDRNQRKPYPDEDKIKEILAETNKFTPQDQLNCGACGYNTCREFAVAITKDFAEKEMCLPYLIDKLDNAYNELKNTQEQLQSAEKLASIGQLAAGVAHEINNPLGTILLYSSMLKKEAEEWENPQHSEDLTLIVEETNRCKNIVSNLLNFARQGKLNISQINIYTLLNKIVKTVRLNPQYKDITFNIEKQKEELKIEGDEDQLKQVFLNIITNACESMEESEVKKINIKKYFQDDELVVEIKDTGCGIEKENRNKVFTPFFTTKKIGKGTGLGLAITYGIIKMHKGQITFTSEPNAGTTFKVRLPKVLNLENKN